MGKNNFILLLIFCFNTQLIGQTCCSGGVPISSNLGLPSSDAKTLQLSLNYDLNVLNTLKTGTTRRDQPESFRRTHTLMLQTGYSFGKRFSTDFFLPLIRQERRSNVNNDAETTNGIGDLILLLKYKIIDKNNHESVLTFGGGVEFPTGQTDLRSSDGTVLLEDFQPGSGSWDGIFWGQFTQVLPFRKSMSFLAQSILKINGKNDASRVPPFTTTYQFGNEFQFITGLSDRILIGKNIFDAALTFRYRHAENDKSKPNNLPQDLTPIPNTGGEWVFINPSITHWFSTDFSINFNIELPLYANIGGTQVTPTFRLNAGIFYRFSKKSTYEVSKF